MHIVYKQTVIIKLNYYTTATIETKFRGGVGVQACHAAGCLEFAFGHLGVMTTQAS